MHDISERSGARRRYLRASRARKGLALLGLTALLALACAAVSAAAPSGAELESRVERLSSELRCLVCDNQSIADSNAQLARDLKGVVREQLAAGRNEEEVIGFLTQRYGDCVLYKPPVKASTWPLWFGPFVLLAGGLVWLWRAVRRQQGGQA